MLPKYLNRFFWDVDTNNLDVNKYKVFIVERLLEYGDDLAIRWVMRTYPDDVLIDVIKCTRKISKKTAGFWVRYYNLDEEEVVCLSEHYQNLRSPLWKH
jgi:hypothetical protein